MVVAMLVRMIGGRALASGVVPVDEEHRATTFELFFDLVFVFALTQISGFMAHAHSGIGVLRGFLLIGLLWWVWSAYAWLSNQARADEGVVRAGMLVAMAAIFVVALAIPEAWGDTPGGLHGPLVLACAYIVVRVIHLVVYGIAAAGDRGLIRQLVVTVAPMLVGSTLLVVGALLGGGYQTGFFAAGLVIDWTATYVTSKGGGWRIHSAGHWAERHGLFVILAIGESVVAIGVGASVLPLSVALVLGAAVGVAVSVGLWWSYFDAVALAAEHELSRNRGAARVQLAIEGYTYLHLPVVAGVLITALGVEGALAHVEDGKGLGSFSAAALHGGLALYLLGLVGVKRRILGKWSVERLLGAVVLLAAIPLSVLLPPLAALTLAATLLAGLVTAETVRFAADRTQLRLGG